MPFDQESPPPSQLSPTGSMPPLKLWMDHFQNCTPSSEELREAFSPPQMVLLVRLLASLTGQSVRSVSSYLYSLMSNEPPA